MNGLAICFIIATIIYSVFFNHTFVWIYLGVVGGYFLLSFIFVPSSARKYNTPRRKIQICTWTDPTSPEIFGTAKVRVSKTLEFIEKARKKTGKKITITHMMCKALAEAIKEFPDINGKLSFGCYVPYDRVDVSCLVAREEGKDLGFVTFENADQKSVAVLAEEASKRVDSVRNGEDAKKLKKASSPFYYMPTCIGGVVMEICSWLAVPLGLNLSLIDIKRHPAGVAVVTNVGMMGVDVAYAPFPSLLRVPLLIVLPSIKEEPIAVDGQVVVEKVLNVCVTGDHRFIDGTRAAQLQNRTKAILEDPERFLSVE